jgi:hypothetical protein
MLPIQKLDAHELATHASITYNAYLQSVLGSDLLLINGLGLEVLVKHKDTVKSPFKETYYDISGQSIFPRSKYNFEKSFIGTLGLSEEELTIPGWLMRGAIREDDGGYLINGPFEFYRMGLESEPYDDPFGNINRFCNHFFDPVNKTAANFTCTSFQSPISAPNWAIGASDAFAAPNAPNAGRRNHFTVFDAREAMYRALTGKKVDGSSAGVDGAEATTDTRNAYWATLFRSLGDILHLNQDMSQPQHTRNESHAGIGGALNIKGNPIFEKYVDARARGAKIVSVGTANVIPAPLIYGGYGIPSFSKYSDYWSSGTSSQSGPGSGLADYSNFGFFTVNANINNGDYANPSPYLSSYPTKRTEVIPSVYGPLAATYLMGSVPDGNRGGADSIRMVRESIWNTPGGNPVYSLDKNVLDDQASLLIPRAVAYSAGLINYFFRGSMKIELPDDGVYGFIDTSTLPSADVDHKGFNKIKLKLSNTSPAAETMGNGKLVAVLKYRRNTCYTENLGGYPPFVDRNSCRSTVDQEKIVVSDPITRAVTTSPVLFEFNFPKALPIDATDVRLQVIYRGSLGQEQDGVVVATKNISEPTFFSYMNASDYTHFGSTVYTRAQFAQLHPNQAFSPFSLTMEMKFGGPIGTKIQISNMLITEFFRVAFLANSETPTVALQTLGYCYPVQFPVKSGVWQDNYDPALPGINTTYPDFTKIRGISGWWGAACVQNGDGSAPGTEDDRDTKMGIVNAENGAPISQTPRSVTINGGAGF